MIHQRDGEPIPEGWGIDADGNPTTDPAAALAGAQLPFGGYKGASIALMVELLAGALVGDLFSFESSEEARGQAAEIIDRLKRGEEAFPEPPAPEPTVADLAGRYMKAHVEVNCRAGTVETFGRAVRLYILPELGHMRLSEVERSHVAALHHRMRDKPYQANQARNVLAKMFRLAEAWGMTPPRRNPCLSIRRYKEYRRERFLSQEESRRRCRRAAGPGAGRGASRRFGVPDGGGGDPAADRDRLPQARDLAPALGAGGPRGGRASPARHESGSEDGAAVADGGARAAEDSAPGRQSLGDPGQGRGPADAQYRRDLVGGVQARRAQGHPHPRLPAQPFASRALALGVSLPMIGRRLGHFEVRTTERYAHLASDRLKESAVRISESIAADILTGYPGVKPGTLAEPRGGPADEDEAIVTPLFPARLRGRSSRAA